jgi:predicted lipid-binding transport protein (Tim44 family)
MTATEKKQQAARDRLTELSTAYTEAEQAFEQAREALSAEIVSVLKARVLGPSEVTRLVPFERQHVGRIAKAGGVPPLREATVVSRKAQQVAEPVAPAQAHRSTPAPATSHAAVQRLTDKQAAELAARAFATATPQQFAALSEAADDGDRAVIEAALTVGALTDTDVLAA